MHGVCRASVGGTQIKGFGEGTDETVDMKWVDTYGADKMAVVKKCDEPESGGDDES